jgi:hypothetical protein
VPSKEGNHMTPDRLDIPARIFVFSAGLRGVR